MGGDSADLVAAIEDAFQVHFEDEEIERTGTVGDLYNLLLTKLPCGEPSGRCASSLAFYRLRRGMVERFSVSRKEVKPSTLMDAIAPKRNRRRNWKAMSMALDLKLPGLQAPSWLLWTVGVLSLAGGVLVGPNPATMMGGITIFFLLGCVALLPFCTEFSAPTVGDMARQVAIMNFVKLVGNRLSEAEVWETLRQVFVAEVCVKAEDVTPDAKIVDDLGID